LEDYVKAGCTNTTDYSNIEIGVYYNDVWAYRLCDVYNAAGANKPARYFDTQCEGEGWVALSVGAKEGGCVIELGSLICNTPSERYEHTTVMFADGLMYVYGGFSERCGDFCDDIWAFDIYLQQWKQVYQAGHLSKLTYEFTTLNAEGKIYYSAHDVPLDSNGWAGPGERWRHSAVVSTPFNYTVNGTTTLHQNMYVFGGHRLWQGYDLLNSQSNNWENTKNRKMGGYLSDFWVYSKELDFTTTPGSTFIKSVGAWKIIERKEKCFDAPGLAWDLRNQKACETIWPLGRAGHGAVLDEKRNLMWIFGGYNTYFPYLSTDGPGSSTGVTSLNVGGFVPYPGYNYFLNDLWIYNFTDGYWQEVVFSDVNMPVPAARTGHVFVLLGDVIFMHGGYADNNYFDDTWYYNITAGYWLEKKKYVYPSYPASCTDDLTFIAEHPECVHLQWPKHLLREQSYPFNILDYSKQPYYWPNSKNGPYWNIMDMITNVSAAEHIQHLLNYSSFPPAGTPEFPYAATGPIQYAQKFVYTFNATHSGVLYSRCTSVFGEPTRGHRVDGLSGRSNGSVLIPQLRRQNPGWDGCRDRADRRKDLPQALSYIKPYARAGHKAIFYGSHNELIMYGGTGYLTENPNSITTTWKTQALDDMWYFNLYHCINNCSSHGDCYFGFCVCWVGYYGEDCSNTSCPGTFCHNDPVTFDNICVHACHAGYRHTDNETYVPDINKVPCSLETPGESYGICDGFGVTQCAPPFIGNDCGTRDCRNNCSFNGWCSVEYPVSRCMCNPGYIGDVCQYQTCLNNCSYPNGVCNITSGQCICRPTYNPYNNTQ
jgi:hypothetical protein